MTRTGRLRALFLATLTSALFLVGMGPRPPVVGGPAPQFRLQELEGGTVDLAALKGKVVLVHFWATWCLPCKKELPEIEKAHRDHQDDGFVVLGLNFGESPDLVKSFVDQMGMTFPVLMDPKVRIASRYGVVNLPVSFFVDSNGIVKERVFGGTLTAEQIGALIPGLSGAAKN